jgi:hypothetical protein
VDPERVQCFERDVVGFHIVDGSGDDTARGDWPTRLSGAIRPTFEWSTSQLSSQPR